MFEKLKLRVKLQACSRYVLVARKTMEGLIRLKYVKMLFIERLLDAEIPRIETSVPVKIRVVSAEDVKTGYYPGVRLTSGDDPSHHGEALRRLGEGDVCLVAMIGDKVAGFAWLYMQERKYEQAIETEITLADKESLLYDRLVFSEFRKKGIGEKLNEERLRFLKSKGFKKALGYVLTNNIYSIKSLEAVGFYPTKIITCFKVFKFKRRREYPVSGR